MNPTRPDWHEITGLTQAEVEERLRAEGCNELPGSQRRTTLTIALASIAWFELFKLIRKPRLG